jgi:hypothetical protein
MQGQLGFDAVLKGDQQQLTETANRCLGEVVVLEVGKGWSTLEGKRPAQHGSGNPRMPGRQFLVAQRPQPLEFDSVQLIIVHLEDIAEGPGEKPGRWPLWFGAKRAAEA